MSLLIEWMIKYKKMFSEGSISKSIIYNEKLFKSLQEYHFSKCM